MNVFPQSWPLEGRVVLIVGTGALAARKAALFEGSPAILRRSETAPQGEAIAEAAFVIVATEDAALAEAAAAAAKAAGKPVNVVDRPDLSDFHVPAIVDRGEIVIAVASGGVAPTLARDVRAAIEVAVPPSTAAVAALARRIRDRVRARWPEVGPRRAAWERILRGAAAEQAKAGDLDGAVAAALTDLASTAAPSGHVHIVGAGPGDPELLTIKALRVLQDADLIVYDRLVDPRILAMARRDADRIFVGKARAQHAVPQEKIHDLLVEAARAGKRVVRLKGGDPFVFGRGGEELEALQRAGIAAFVVPGITAALGCAAAVGAPLTHRDHAQAVTFITGHAREDGDGDEPQIDWSALTAPNHTLVIYMGAARAGAVAARLVAAGRAATTPVLIVENGTRPDQTVTPATLADLGAVVDAAKPAGPTMLIVGDVVAAAAQALIAQAWRRAA